jgi:hypothetical protein
VSEDGRMGFDYGMSSRVEFILEQSINLSYTHVEQSEVH